MKAKLLFYGATTLGVAASLGLTGCGGAKSSSSSASLSGTLASTQSYEFFAHALASQLDPVRRLALQSGTASEVDCFTNGIPPKEAKGAISSSGSFDVDLSAVSGQAVNCSIVDEAGNELATFVFQDSSHHAMDGSAQSASTVPITGNTAVGTVDIAGGAVVVNGVTLTLGQALTASEAFDPTGQWALGSVSFTPPPGYDGPCAVGDNSCHGPQAGQTVYIQRIVGKAFTPDATCASAVSGNTFTSGSTCSGTAGSDDAFALGIWMAKQTMDGCGDRLGATFDQAKAYANIDFTGQAVVNSGDFTWSPSVTISSTVHNLTNGWQDDHATSNWEMDNCTQVTLNGHQVYKCFDSGATHYSLSLGGGCVDASNNPVQPDNWSHVSFGGGSCTQGTAISLGSVSLTPNTCPATYTPSGGSPETIYCGGAWGAFNVSDNAVYGGSFTNDQIIAQSGLCSSAGTGTNAAALDGDECYANYFYQNLQSIPQRTDPTVCLNKIQTNWGATSASQFIASNGPSRAVNEAAIEKLVYLSTTSASMTQMQTQYPGIQVQDSSGSNTFVPCAVNTVENDDITEIDSTHIVVKMKQTTTLADTKSACIAAASDPSSSAYQQLQLGVQRMIFEMTKQ